MKNALETLGIAILRIVAGLSMATHGYGKIFTEGRMDKFAGGVGEMGFPQPELFAWLAALSELVGGVCLALGLGTRFSAFLIGCTMVVAVFIKHAADAFEKKELGLLYLAIMVYFLVAGGGRLAADSLLNRRKAVDQ